MMPGMHTEITCELLARPTIAPPATVIHAATNLVLSTVCPGPNLLCPFASAAGPQAQLGVLAIEPSAATPPASGAKCHRAQADERPPSDDEITDVATSSGLRPRSKRLTDKHGPLFVDVVAQASYLKAKKMGEKLPPPLTSKQL